MCVCARSASFFTTLIIKTHFKSETEFLMRSIQDELQKERKADDLFLLQLNEFNLMTVVVVVVVALKVDALI